MFYILIGFIIMCSCKCRAGKYRYVQKPMSCIFSGLHAVHMCINHNRSISRRCAIYWTMIRFVLHGSVDSYLFNCILSCIIVRMVLWLTTEPHQHYHFIISFMINELHLMQPQGWLLKVCFR